MVSWVMWEGRTLNGVADGAGEVEVVVVVVVEGRRCRRSVGLDLLDWKTAEEKRAVAAERSYFVVVSGLVDERQLVRGVDRDVPLPCAERL